MGPKQQAALGSITLRRVNVAASAMFAMVWSLQFYVANWDFITSTLVSFFGTSFLRKLTLDALYKRRGQPCEVKFPAPACGAVIIARQWRGRGPCKCT